MPDSRLAISQSILRLDLAAFYPFLAVLAATCRVHIDMPINPAILHTIVNAPNPGASPAPFPDGSAANLILLGEPIPLEESAQPAWWPSAHSPKVRSKLWRRIQREGYALPIMTSVCIALLAEMYTTTSGHGSSERRVRLRYGRSPISDFGIACGSVDVKNQDKLAYFNLLDGSLTKGQDPDDHYWMYFTTIRGEEFVLDIAMFTFNMCLMVPTSPYIPSPPLPPMEYAPAFFRDRTLSKNTPDLHTERKRFSVLRNSALHHAIQHSGSTFRSEDTKAICEFMESVAERKCTPVEKNLAMTWLLCHCQIFTMMIEDRWWTNYPSQPALAVETDPGEMDDCWDEPGEEEEWFKYMKTWNKRYKKGKTSKEALGDAWRAWNERRLAEKLKH